MKKATGLSCLLLTFTLIATSACGEDPAPPSPKADSTTEGLRPNVIYGRDDRLDIYQVTDPAWRARAQATAALVRNSRISARPGSVYALKTGNFGRDYNLCPSEPFRDQSTAAFCSGFFIGEDLMVTAGHCIKNSMDCNETFFVFGFNIAQAGGQAPDTIPSSQVYRCFSVVKSTVSRTDGVDFAVVRLDRPVRGVEPVTLRTSPGTAPVGAELAVIGHPTGLPTKLAANAFVREVQPDYLVANLDTFGGNSGSAVFNAKTGEVEGILVRGETDFSYQGDCRVSNVCPDGGCRGEDVTRIDHVRESLNRVRFQ